MVPPMPTASGDDQWAAYARTVVEILRPHDGNIVVGAAPGAPVGDWPWASPQPVHILTAWDPGHERLGAEENRMRQAALEADLRVVTDALWFAVGFDPVSGHREEGVAASGVSEAATLAMGARYRQEAIFVWTPDSWAIVACGGSRRWVGAWQLLRPT
jgi:hypothetical protein